MFFFMYHTVEASMVIIEKKCFLLMLKSNTSVYNISLPDIKRILKLFQLNFHFKKSFLINLT